MEIYSTLASTLTVVSLFVFAGIVAWAYSARRKSSFEAASLEPFALPDELEDSHHDRREEKSHE
jgi:cbb3-type cytochrome oxidase subunit 3